MKLSILSATVGLTFCLPVGAQYMQVEGGYSSPTLAVQVILLDSGRGVAAATATVVSGSCSGSIAGTGNIKDRTLTIVPYKKVEGGDACQLTLEFDKGWKQVKVLGQQCQAYSGAACGFEGQSAKKRNER